MRGESGLYAEFIFLPELAGGEGVIFFKELGKIIGVRDAAMLGNGLDLQGAALQKMPGGLHALLKYPLGHGLARFLVEKSGKIAGGNILLPGQGMQAQIPGKIDADIGDGFCTTEEYWPVAWVRTRRQ